MKLFRIKMKERELFILIAVIGVSIGLSASYLVQGDSSNCKNIEKQIKEQQKFNGSLTCYPPGVLDVNISDKVEERANLDCVCRKVNNGNVHLFPILSTSNLG